MRVFLDFEASSLAKESYPIEVAWVFEDGRAESHLIRPPPAWTDWDPRAEAIHHIAREVLLAEGMPVEDLAALLLATLAGHRLYASSPSWDGKWLSLLLRAGGLPRHALRLRDTDEAQYEAAIAPLAPHLSGAALETTAKSIIDRIRLADRDLAIAHRALPDAERERRLWLAIRDEAETLARTASPQAGFRPSPE
jgi:hypothetical protein